MSVPLQIEDLESRRQVLNRERFFSQFQPLADLGYISHSQIRDSMPAHMREAIVRAFRSDYLNAGINLHRVNYEHPGAYQQYASLLNVAEEELLHTMVSLNGAFSFFKVPDPKDVLLYHIATFRLKLLGVFPTQTDHGSNIEMALSNLSSLLGDLAAGKVELLNIAGNLDLLIQAYLHNCTHNLTHKIAFVKRSDGVAGKEVQALIDSPQNDFVARLYQLFLWKNEFYNGRIDGQLGAMSKQSLTDLITVINKATNRSLTVDNLTGVDDQLPYELWNIGDLLRLFPDQYSSPEKTSTTSSVLEREISDDFPLDDVLDVLGTIITEDSMQKRQSYFGNPLHIEPIHMSGLEKDLIQPILDKKIRGRRKLLNKALRKSGSVKNAFRKLIQKLRKGLTLFLHGIRYLSGERTVITNENNNTLVTQFDVDFDVVALVNGQASEKAFRHHREKVSYLSYSLSKSLSFTGKVIKVAWAVSGPLGWYRLARIAASLLEN